jgi:hypothetical protein
VPDCYFGLRAGSPGQAEPAGVLVVASASLLHRCVLQPAGTVLYELVTGHPDRVAHELVFLPDLTVELRAWPLDTWAKVEIDRTRPPARWRPARQRGDLLGLRQAG